MEDEEGGAGGMMRSKKKSSSIGGGEVDYKTKAGTAWSHSYLNQKPWHPLSYPNQRRKWIAEQYDAQRQRRADEVAREFAQEQEFFRQTALVSKKEKEKVEMMKAVSFMYVRPPGYNAESAKAAELEDERKRLEQTDPFQESTFHSNAHAMQAESSISVKSGINEEKKKPRLKDIYGRPLPTEEEFEALKNAPRIDTGLPTRAKPFGVEIRNVKCVRCGTFGHQSGDRECPLKDVIMPIEESRLKRNDPLTAILAHADSTEPLKWELKQKPGISPPRGGYKPDDPNQQIVAEDIFDEYGGFLNGGSIPEMLASTSVKKSRKHSSSKSKPRSRSSKSYKARHKDRSPSISNSDDDMKERSKRSVEVHKKKKHKRKPSYSCSSEKLDSDKHGEKRKRKDSELSSSDNLDSHRNYKSRHRSSK
ncbi:hypothetical protein Scep_009924 [Stephania cephalantha]|uniref:CBF1-interacting co-repressor CIR N-terminal domain-containing protein n=1 Tax=Stephania cephalantha TaxID=152367 RepID=A0AAP0PCW9_9MAGN